MKNKLKIIIILLIIFLYIISGINNFSSASEPYTYSNNIIWNKKVLYVYIQENNTIIQEMFKDWQKKTDNYFKFNFSKDPLNADISVLFTNDDIKTLGAYTKYYYNDNNIIKVEIILPKKDFNNKEIQKDFKQFIIKHEIGHSIGIAKHSQNKADIMYPYKTNENFDISKNDVIALKDAYQNKIKKETDTNIDANKYDLPYIANVYKRAGKYDKAIEIYDKILEKNPNFPLALYSKGYCFFKMKDYKNACKFAQRAYEIEQDNEIFLNLYIKCLCKQNNKETAKSILNDFIKNNPQNSDSMLIIDCQRVLNR